MDMSEFLCRSLHSKHQSKICTAYHLSTLQGQALMISHINRTFWRFHTLLLTLLDDSRDRREEQASVGGPQYFKCLS